MRSILSKSTLSEPKIKSKQETPLTEWEKRDVLVTLDWAIKFLPRKYREEKRIELAYCSDIDETSRRI